MIQYFDYIRLFKNVLTFPIVINVGTVNAQKSYTYVQQQKMVCKINSCRHINNIKHRSIVNGCCDM